MRISSAAIGQIILLSLLSSIALPVIAGDKVNVKPMGEYAKIDTSRDAALTKVLLDGDASAKERAAKPVLQNPQKYSPAVLYALGTMFFGNGKKDDAIFWFCVGQLRARYDANRCADDSARSAVGMLTSNIGAPVSEYMYSNISQVESIIPKVLDWDAKHPYDYDHRWINLHGSRMLTEDKSIATAPMSLPKAEWDTILRRTRADFRAAYERAIAESKQKKQKTEPVSAAAQAFLRAAYSGDLKSVQAALAQNISLTTRNEAGETALHLAAKNGHVEVVKTLLKHGAKVDALSNGKVTPLQLAALHRQSAVLAAMLASSPKIAPADPVLASAVAWLQLDEKGHPPLPVVELLLKHGAAVSATTIGGGTALNSAAMNGYLDVCRLLVAKGSNVNHRDDMNATPLYRASQGGHIEVCRFLLQKGANPNISSQGETPLFNACRHCNPELIELLLKSGADPKVQNNDGMTALFMALHHMYPGRNSRQSKNKLPISEAQQLKTVTLLLNAGIDPNKGAPFFGLPFITVVNHGTVSVAKLLLDKGAKVNVGDKTISPLHCAASRGDLEMIKLLVTHGANVNATDTHKKTPLSRVMGPQSEQIRQYLIAHGAK